MLDLLAIGGITFDYLFWVDRLPKKHFESVIKKHGRFFGGRAPNVGVAAAKLGIKTGLVSPVGEDFAREGYESYLRTLEVDLRGVISVRGKETKQIFIYTDSQGNQMTFFDYGAERYFRKMDVPCDLIKESKIVHLSSGDYRFNIRCARFAYENGVSVSFDPGNDPFIEIPKYLKTMMQCSEFLFMNDIELRAVMRQLGTSKIGDLLDFGPRTVIIIRKSDKSSLIHTRDGVERVPSAIHVQKDPTGASDGYVAAFLSARIKGYDLKEAGMFGAAEASFVAEKWGAQTNFPNWNALHRRYESLIKEALDR